MREIWEAGGILEGRGDGGNIGDVGDIVGDIGDGGDGAGRRPTPRARRQIYDRRGTLDCFDVSAFLSPPPDPSV